MIASDWNNRFDDHFTQKQIFRIRYFFLSHCKNAFKINNMYSYKLQIPQYLKYAWQYILTRKNDA